MRRRGGTGKPAKPLRRKVAGPKPRKPAEPERPGRPLLLSCRKSLLSYGSKSRRSTRELSEAREQQTASSEVLQGHIEFAWSDLSRCSARCWRTRCTSARQSSAFCSSPTVKAFARERCIMLRWRWSRHGAANHCFARPPLPRLAAWPESNNNSSRRLALGPGRHGRIRRGTRSRRSPNLPGAGPWSPCRCSRMTR